MADDVQLSISADVSDAELSLLHAAAFGYDDPSAHPWNVRLRRYSLFWVTARKVEKLVGFVNVLGDGGVHAIVMDTCVWPSAQRQGIGRALVSTAAEEARRRGCAWLHADYAPEHVDFYEQACGLSSTHAGLIDLAR